MGTNTRRAGLFAKWALAATTLLGGCGSAAKVAIVQGDANARANRENLVQLDPDGTAHFVCYREADEIQGLPIAEDIGRFFAGFGRSRAEEFDVCRGKHEGYKDDVSPECRHYETYDPASKKWKDPLCKPVFPPPTNGKPIINRPGTPDSEGGPHTHRIGQGEDAAAKVELAAQGLKGGFVAKDGAHVSWSSSPSKPPPTPAMSGVESGGKGGGIV